MAFSAVQQTPLNFERGGLSSAGEAQLPPAGDVGRDGVQRVERRLEAQTGAWL